MPHAARHPALSLAIGAAALLAVAAGPATHPADPVDPAAGKADAKPVDAKPVAPKPPAERGPLPPVGAVRELDEQDRQEAIADRDAADLLRSHYEEARRLRNQAGAGAGAGGAAGAGAAGDDAAYNEVVAAYRRAIGRFPGTEVECYCRLRLAGAYQYRGLFDAALNESKQAAERFAGTGPGLGATQAVALTYLQALHDPANAAIWFHQLQTAAGAVKDDAERGKWQAAAAEGLARCAAERPPAKK
jgi:hypothetical protein